MANRQGLIEWAFCFARQVHRDVIMETLGFAIVSSDNDEFRVWIGPGACRVSECALTDVNIRMLKKTMRPQNIVVFNRHQSFGCTQVYSMETYENVLGGGRLLPTALSAHQAEQLRCAFESFTTLQQEQQRQYANEFFGTLVHVHLHQPTVLLSPRGSVTIIEKDDNGWVNTLRDTGDAPHANDPICITCETYRASVCFLPCGHQAMCDVCVKRLWSLADAQKQCPVCRCRVDNITRPITSAAAAASE